MHPTKPRAQRAPRRVPSAHRGPVTRAIDALPLPPGGAAVLARLVADRDHRAVVGAHASLAIDAIWALANLAMGALSGSIWFVTLASYYLLHVVMRIVLVRHARSDDGPTDERRVLRACRACGVLVAASMLAVAGIVVLVMHEEGGFFYPGTLIYAVALYAFYALIMGAVNVAAYRAHANPVLFAIANVNLATALVSMFALQAAMLAAFDTTGDAAFKTLMTSITGMAVGLLVAGIGTWLVVRSTRALRSLRAPGR